MEEKEMRINRPLVLILDVAHGPRASLVLTAAGLWLFFLICSHCEPETPWYDNVVTTIEIREGGGHLYRVSQDRGERDLHQLARFGDREDAWLYFNDTWLDVGSEEQTKTITLDPGIIESLIEHNLKVIQIDIPRRSRLVIIYHIHLLGEDKTSFNPPSCEDIYALALLKYQCRRLAGIELVGKVCDGLGMWEFDISRDQENRLCLHNDAADPMKAEELYPDYPPEIALLKQRDAQESFFFELLIATRKICQNTELSRNEKIRAYIDSMKELGIIVKYEQVP